MKISFCITCKNRLYHLEQTLPVNMLNSASYAEREFVIMDYNSQDGLYSWAKEHLKYWSDRGIIRYCRTRIPKYFVATHAKNIAHKCATGDVLCNLDADNFIMPGFCEFLNDAFQDPKAIYFSGSLDVTGSHGCCGRIATHKEHFFNVNGYDEEQYLGWGWEDVNFRFRTAKHNQLKGVLGNIKWNRCIDHGNETRAKFFESKEIEKTSAWSKERLKVIRDEKSYIANVGKQWGYIEDLEIGL